MSDSRSDASMNILLASFALSELNQQRQNEACAILFGYFLVLGILVLNILYIIYGIIFMDDDWDEYLKCDKSNLGPYMVTSVVYSVLALNSFRGEENRSKDIGFITMVLGFALLIWGGIEVFDNACDDLKETDLYKIAFYRYVVDIALYCFLVLYLFCAALFVIP